MVADRSSICRTQGAARVLMKTPLPSEESALDKCVLIKELATYLGRERSSLGVHARKIGCKIFKVRDPESGKIASAITEADARRILEVEVPRIKIMRPEDIGRKP